MTAADDPVAVAAAGEISAAAAFAEHTAELDFFGDGLRAEMRAAFRQLRPADRSALIQLGIAADDIDRFRLCGVERVRFRRHDLYEPDEDGHEVFITPVRIDVPMTPESPNPVTFVRRGRIVDLVAWHPGDPESWALRRGSAEWLGCIEPQYLDPDPVRLHRSVLGWLGSGCVGLVPLSNQPTSIYRVLCWCQGGIIAEDDEHRAALRQALIRPWPHPRIQVAREPGR